MWHPVSGTSSLPRQGCRLWHDCFETVALSGGATGRSHDVDQNVIHPVKRWTNKQAMPQVPEESAHQRIRLRRGEDADQLPTHSRASCNWLIERCEKPPRLPWRRR